VAPDGSRQIHGDLKDFGASVVDISKIPHNASMAIATNVNFSRGILKELQKRSIPIATDVHALSDVHDAYNKDFLKAADIVFLSGEGVPGQEIPMLNALASNYSNIKLMGMGLGSHGSLLYLRERNEIYHLASVNTRPIINTVGAGDSFFSSFLHEYNLSQDPFHSMQCASVFASWKIGENGASIGFPGSSQFNTLKQQFLPQMQFNRVS
jgi:ribokinase